MKKIISFLMFLLLAGCFGCMSQKEKNIMKDKFIFKTFPRAKATYLVDERRNVYLVETKDQFLLIKCYVVNGEVDTIIYHFTEIFPYEYEFGIQADYNKKGADEEELQ